tara:strand:- start:50367 stop:52190 length:1824 start_codon:yes stop_codon:yes gene_type:complete
MATNRTVTNTMSSSNVLDAYNLVGTDGRHQVLFLGGLTGNSPNTNTPFDRNRISNEISIVKRIKRNDVIPVVQRVDWTSGSPYNYYNTRDGNVADGSYAYYALASNGVVYLCLSNNDKNRSDLSLQIASTVEPSHRVGIQKYSDGYTWMALFKIDYTLSKFLTSNWIPVPILENLFSELNTGNSLVGLATDICGSSAGVLGACCLYNKTKEFDPITSIEITGGNLFDCFSSIPCYRCKEISDALNKERVFIQGATCASCPPTTEIQSLIEKIDAKRDNFAKNSTIITQRDIQQDSEINDGRILSAFIDLSGISASNLITTEQNPVVDLNNGGADGDVRLSTYPIIDPNERTRKYVIDGIFVNNPGNGYHVVDPYVEPAGNSIADILSSRLFINLDTRGSLSKDLVEILNVNKLLTKVCLTSEEIQTLNSKARHQKFSRFGILQQVKDSNGRIIGQGLNTNEGAIKSATYLITATTSSSQTMRIGEQLSSESGIILANGNAKPFQNSGRIVGVDATGGTNHVLRIMTDKKLSVGEQYYVSIDPIQGGIPFNPKLITLTTVNEPDVDLDLTETKVLHTGNTNIDIPFQTEFLSGSTPRKEYCFEFVKVF